MSPAVITETVWALAHEEQPTIPHTVIALTTRRGAQKIQEMLFDGGGWKSLVGALASEGLMRPGHLRFGPSSDLLRLLPDAAGQSNLEDIDTPGDSMAAADFMLRTVREFTEDDTTRVILSLAGGRKTMSALMMSCATLLGRPQDRVCHVLVNPPYDSPLLDPPFLFPAPDAVHRLQGVHYRADAASLRLADIPFVRVRDWYRDKFSGTPPSYDMLVNRVQHALARGPAPQVEVDLSSSVFMVGEEPLSLSASEAAVFAALLRRRYRGLPDCSAWADLCEDIDKLKGFQDVPAGCRWLHDFQAAAPAVDKEMVRKTASSLRKKLESCLESSALANSLVPRMQGGRPFMPYPEDRLRFTDLPDVC